MSPIDVTVTLATVAANGFIAACDLTRAPFVLANSAGVGVPRSWLTPLGLLKGAGAAGLLLGLLGVPLVGVAAGVGLTLFFVGAIVTHLRARNYDLAFPALYLVLAVASLIAAAAR